MKQAPISSEQIDRLMHIKKLELDLQKEINHVRVTGSRGIMYLSKLVDKLSDLQLQKENLIRSM